MTVKQVIDLAKASELTGLPAASKDETVLGFINLGVLELYKRFTLSVEQYNNFDHLPKQLSTPQH